MRAVATELGWLAPSSPLPDDAVLSAQFDRREAPPASCVSTLEHWLGQVAQRHAQGIQGATIHAALARNHGYTGSYSSAHRFVSQLLAEPAPDVPLRLDFKPGEAGNRCHGTTREKPLTRFKYDKCLYSVPFRLMGQDLWPKATDGLASVYRDHELVATHPRQTRPGARSTVPDHRPPEALAWNLQDTQWCLREARRIGPRCHDLAHALFADEAPVNLLAAQGVLRLEAACARAISFGSVR